MNSLIPFRSSAMVVRLLALTFVSSCIGLVAAVEPPVRVAEVTPDKALISTRGLPPLFNGTNLDGWIIRGGKASYVVENETIVGTVTAKGGGNTFLCTDKDYGDFLLELEINADKGLNSGVQVRSLCFDSPKTYSFGSKEIKVAANRVHGYQVEVDNRTDRRWGGGVYEEARRDWLFPLPTNSPAGQAFKFGEWNHYRIRCVGASIKTWVNDIPAADLLDAEALRGFIGLQVHSSDLVGKQVRFRNVRLRDLGQHEWQTAWDCRSFDGLDQFGRGEWKLNDGVLHVMHSASESQPAILQGRGLLNEFTIRFKYKLGKGGFDLAFRTTNDANAPAEFSFPVTAQTGSHLKPQDWNSATVMVQGKRVVVKVNGYPALEAQNEAFPKGVYPALILAGGQEADVQLQGFEILQPVR